MPTKQTRAKRRQKKQMRKRFTRKQLSTPFKSTKGLAIVAPPAALNLYSPISSPGTPNRNTVSPIRKTNSPITKRAKELALLFPNQRAMLRRATSFNNTGISNDEFYERLEKELGVVNQPYFPEDHFTDRYR